MTNKHISPMPSAYQPLLSARLCIQPETTRVKAVFASKARQPRVNRSSPLLFDEPSQIYLVCESAPLSSSHGLVFWRFALGRRSLFSRPLFARDPRPKRLAAHTICGRARRSSDALLAQAKRLAVAARATTPRDTCAAPTAPESPPAPALHSPCHLMSSSLQSL